MAFQLIGNEKSMQPHLFGDFAQNLIYFVVKTLLQMSYDRD